MSSRPRLQVVPFLLRDDDAVLGAVRDREPAVPVCAVPAPGPFIAARSLVPHALRSWEPEVVTTLDRAALSLVITRGAGIGILTALDLPPSILHDVRVLALAPHGRRRPPCPVYEMSSAETTTPSVVTAQLTALLDRLERERAEP